LIGVNEVEVPSSEESVFKLVRAGPVHPAFAVRDSPGSREMHEISRVCVAESVVSGDTPTREPLSAILLVLRGLCVLIAHALRPRVVRKGGQAIGKLMLVGQLHRVVTACSVGSLIRGVPREARVGNVVLCVDTRWENLGWRVVVAEIIQVPPHRTYIPKC